jgi:hypothetical protein
MMDNTTELCGNCHSNVRYGNTGPGWTSTSSSTKEYLIVDNKTLIKPHGFPAKDLFVGSEKETSQFFKFECTTCHFAKQTKNFTTGASLTADERNGGHSFQVNTTILMNGTKCSSCHVTGSTLGNLSTTIENVQAQTHTRWNSTNATVMSALNTIKAYSGEKTLSKAKIAQAYWNLQWVSSEESWGVHNPAKVNQLLDDAVILANEAVDSLGEVTSSVDLVTGWNLVALKGTPSVNASKDVMSSVSSDITVVWGYNTSAINPIDKWELYDPDMDEELNDLLTIVPGKGYWINAIKACKWTV